MASSQFDGNIVSLRGIHSRGPNSVVTLGTTATITMADHGGRICLVPTTCAITLPAIIATADGTGSGPGADPNNLSNLGCIFTFFFTAVSAGATSQTITTGAAASADKYVGVIGVSTSGAAPLDFYSTVNSVITLNATTTGGAAVGSWLRLIPIAAVKWAVEGHFLGSGTQATPFS